MRTPMTSLPASGCGSNFAGPRADFPVAVPIASHCLHAAGVAYAFKLRREPRVAVCVSGDGSTSNGAFYEAIKLLFKQFGVST